MTADGTLTVLYAFSGSDGSFPTAALLQGNDGNFYGTTQYGGAWGYGTVFMMTPDGALTTLHAFDGVGGSWPSAPLVQGRDGSFYGVTANGGNIVNDACSDYGCGTVFRIAQDGTFVSLHSFDSSDGAGPHAALLQQVDGMFFGTTATGGASGKGTVFEVMLDGTTRTLLSFNGPNGSFAFSGLVRGTDGSLYGTTYGTTGNSDSNKGTIFKLFDRNKR